MNDRDKRFCLIGSGSNVRRIFYANSEREAEAWASTAGLEYFAIYRNDAKFHGAHQKEFLLYHRNDPYWINRGVASAS